MPIQSELDQYGLLDLDLMLNKNHGRPLPETDEEFFRQEILPNLQGRESEEVSQIVLGDV